MFGCEWSGRETSCKKLFKEFWTDEGLCFTFNILNASEAALQMGGKLITLSGFKPDNKLKGKGHVNFHLPIENYGIVECFHQVILHAMLDEYVNGK